MSELAFVYGDLASGETIREVIVSEDYSKRAAADEWSGRKALAEKPADPIAVGSFTAAELREAINEALAGRPVAGIEIVSGAPEWVELCVPCDRAAISPLQKLLAQLDTDLPQEIGEAIGYAFREMISNAVEYGGRLDPEQRVEIRFLRLKRAVICRIKDPGEGLDPARLQHAATNNPNDDPLHHASVREVKGLRAGSFGILLTSQLVDELVYNERHNELLFVKYLS
jgi:anti-sigma regulatory factor (Ser/Thr protein kinase)